MKSYRTDTAMSALLSKDMKIVELIDLSCDVLPVFLRLDMQLPFGDRSVEELCGQYGLSSDMFLMLCQIYLSADVEPDVELLEGEDLRHLLRYLHASHRYYTDVLLPTIENGVERVLKACDRKQSLIVRKFYDDYADEVRSHLEYEEQVIFPYVERVIAGLQGEVSIEQSMANHSDICDKVDDMKSIIIKYLPESCPTAERYELLCDLFRLRDDLAKHTLIEVAVLTPLVAKLEKELAL